MCGLVTVVHISKLAFPCVGANVTAHGARNLRKLSAGHLPKGVTQWPHYQLETESVVDSLVTAEVKSQVTALAQQEQFSVSHPSRTAESDAVFLPNQHSGSRTS